MKTTLTLSYNGIICLLILLMALQSCRVYKSDLYTTEKAVEIGENVKIKMVNEKSYFFKKLTVENDELIGYAKKNSKAAKHFESKVFENQNENSLVRVLLDKNEIEEIKVQDQTGSIIVSALGVALFIGGIIGLSSGGFVSPSPALL